MAVVVRDVDAATELLEGLGETVSRIGVITAHDGPPEVLIDLPDGWGR
jgi:hypothetical protein